MTVEIKYNLSKIAINKLADISRDINDFNYQDKELKLSFEIRYEDIEKIWEEFLKSYVSVEAAKRAGFDRETHLMEYDSFENKMYSIRTTYSKYYKTSAAQSVTVEKKPEMGANRFHLPNIQIATFSGNTTEYLNFRNIFKSLIHDDIHMQPVQKMHYLMGCLKGEPLNIIKHLPLSNENYDIAFGILEKRYFNTRVISEKHLEAILSTQLNGKTSLRQFLNIMDENLLALQALKFNVHEWSFVLLHITLKKLPIELRNRFEREYSECDIPTFLQLTEFMDKECRALEASSSQKDNQTQKELPRRQCAVVSNTEHKCECCGKMHFIFSCSKFKNLTVQERIQFIKRSNLCWNCLYPHRVQQCTSMKRCKMCNGKHNSLLHKERNSTIAGADLITSEQKTSHTVLAATSQSNTVLIATVILQLRDQQGNFHRVRGFIDPGSMCSLITESCVQRLKLKKQVSSVSISGVGGDNPHFPKSYITSIVKPVDKKEPQILLQAYVMKRITNSLPLKNISENIYHQFSTLNLADKDFHVSRPIDILLGADIYNDIMEGKKLTLDPNLPSAYSTIFGWVILGKFREVTKSENSTLLTHTVTLEKLVQKFWELEQIPESNSISPEDENCERHFTETISRTKEGRFVARLPFKEGAPTLGESKNLALKRFFSLENKLEKTLKLKHEYSEVLHEYIRLGHMERALSSDIKYFLPHHCVIKNSSSSTRVRVVFDASMKSNNGLSLNDMLNAGPKLQQNIMDVLFNFRLHQIAFTADIKQMYRQVILHEEDRNYHGIFWRDSPDKPLEVFRLTTVTFGVSSSPFIAMRCLVELAKQGQASHPNGSRIIQKEIYVDDIISGAKTVQDALKVKTEVTDLLATAGFELRKWASNSEEFLSHIPREYCEEMQSFDSKSETGLRVLGIQWVPLGDYFKYNVNIVNTTMTKRAILSNIARLYDPCGWLTPITFFAKSILQEIWLLKVGWDDVISNSIAVRWDKFISQLSIIMSIKIRRCIISLDSSIKYQLHGFSDASEKGFAVSIYLRAEDKDGNVEIYLLMGKSKVAPIKQKLSIPKMELCGVHLLSKSLKYVQNSLNTIKITNIFAWCDSKVALSWLRTPVHRLKTFEANRVSQIHNNFNIDVWRYVPSSWNPSDCASRGILPHQIVDHKSWWKPLWLTKSMSEWPKDDVVLIQDDDPTFTYMQVIRKECTWDLFMRYSSFTRLIRITALLSRFIHNSKPKEMKQIGYLSATEWNNALLKLVKFVQLSEFSDDIKLIRRGMRHRTSFYKLRPFIDENGIVRVDGRLQQSSLSYSAKHPMILPKNHEFTILVVKYYHVMCLHAGPSLTLSNLRQIFWIVSGRSVVRQVVHKCVQCFRTKPKTVEPLMAALPKVRVQPGRAFLQTGSDYAGPFYVKSSTLRNAKTQKAYLVIFICMATKGVHLELVSDLSTPAFLAAMDRFVARRGYCTDLYSDEGSNYVGADHQLREVHKFLNKKQNTERITEYMTQRNIKFHRNPPTGPHMGGLWERSVYSIKNHLKRVIGDTRLTFEELYTVLTKVEAILNSRPLCPMTDNPDDLDVLTPGHFLVGEPLMSVPEFNFESTPLNHLSRWELLRSFSQSIWRRWQREYLHSLHQRSKWTRDRVNVNVNDLVLIKDDNLPPLKWKKARIVKLYPGRDNVVRVVKIKTSTGELCRPVTKICPLPLDK